MKKLIARFLPEVTMILPCLFFLSLPLSSQTRPDGTAPQYLFSYFSKSNVLMKNGQTQSLPLNYNIVTERMVYEKDKELYDMINTEMIDTVYLQDSKFIPFGKVFYEVLLKAPATLFVQHKGGLIPPGAPAGYGGTSQVSNTKQLSSVELSSGYYNLKLPADYTVNAEPVYWIRKDSTMLSFINERQFLKLFPENENELKQYIKQSKIRFLRLSDIVKLVSFYNDLIR